MRKLYGLVWLLLFGVVITGQAQRIVRGTVQDVSTKQGLPGVTVLLKGTEKSVYTNMQGDFQLAILRDTVTLVFSSVGYETVEKRIVVTQDTTMLPLLRLKEECTIDFFDNKHIELSFLSGLRSTPLGGKIKILYPYLLHIPHSAGTLRAEFSYQSGNANYQRNGTLALDNLFINCDNNIDVTTDYQSVRLGEQGFAYTRYTAGATYTGKSVSQDVPIYLAIGRLSYLAEGITAIKAGVEVGINIPFSFSIYSNDSRTSRFQIIPTARIAWWQDYWQFQSSLEAQIKRFSVGVNFNNLGQYTEVNTSIGFKIERRYRAKKASN